MTRETIIANPKARVQAARLAEQQRLQTASEHGIEYSLSHPGKNLCLLRAYFDATQADFRALLRIPNQPQYSQIERGDRELPTSDARAIESALDLPSMWLDRRNISSLFLSQDGLSMVSTTRSARPGVAFALADLVKLLNR